MNPDKDKHARDRRDIKWFSIGVLIGLLMFLLTNYLNPGDPRCENQLERKY